MTIPVPGDMWPDYETKQVAYMEGFKQRAYLEGRRYQHQQDVEFLTEYFSWLCLTQPWDKAGTVWQTFVNLMSEGE